MDKNSEVKMAIRKDQESHSNAMPQMAASAKDGLTRGIKRKATSNQKTPKKTAKASNAEPHNTPEEDTCVKTLKRKVREDGEGPTKTKKKKRRLDIIHNDKASTSSSVDEPSSKGSSKSKAAPDGEGPSPKKKTLTLKETKKNSIDARKAEFEDKYKQQYQLGKGGCGSVFAGYRKADNLPVAIKHIPNDRVLCKHKNNDGSQISVEVAIMLKLAAETNGSVGASAPVSLLDWYDLDQELILVMERPVPCKDLFAYIRLNRGSLKEEVAKIILKQLVDAAKDLEDKHIFHRDIKVENILIETALDVPRVRLIDFGLSCFVEKGSVYHNFFGTRDHIPPECFNSYTYTAGPTTVWQMGVVLFELVNRAMFQTLNFVRNKLHINNNLSENCRDFLRICLRIDPKERPTLEQLQRHPWLR